MLQLILAAMRGTRSYRSVLIALQVMRASALRPGPPKFPVQALCFLLFLPLSLWPCGMSAAPVRYRATAHPATPVTYTEEDIAWETQFGSYVRSLVAKPSECVADNTVIHTMSNKIDWDMVGLQTQLISNQKCFFTRFVIITLDDQAHAQCQKNPDFQCQRYIRSYGHAEYLKGDYVEVVFLKLKSLLAIVKQGITAYFFDADVVFFKIPQFPPVDSYDIILQADNYDFSCEFSKSSKSENPSLAFPECVRPSAFNLSTNTGQIGFSSKFKDGVRFLEDVIKCGVRMTVRRGNQVRAMSQVLGQHGVLASV